MNGIVDWLLWVFTPPLDVVTGANLEVRRVVSFLTDSLGADPFVTRPVGGAWSQGAVLELTIRQAWSRLKPVFETAFAWFSAE